MVSNKYIIHGISLTSPHSSRCTWFLFNRGFFFTSHSFSLSVYYTGDPTMITLIYSCNFSSCFNYLCMYSSCTCFGLYLYNVWLKLHYRWRPLFSFPNYLPQNRRRDHKTHTQSFQTSFASL